MIQIRNSRDFAAGLFLLLFAAFIIWSTWDLPIGRGVRLGPGFMPIFLGSLIGLFGIGVMASGMLRQATTPVVWTINLRAAICVLAALAMFGLLVERAGLLVAAPVLLLIASLAFGRPRLVETTLFIVGLTALTIGLFIYALGLTIPVLN